ncbi:MAG: methyltransferase type 11 [Anaerolineales bacterium]|nr:class I SAM-dependent methyltransferase [Anaerolineae bacterium]PWB70090.1 MAG: methyltransferase type 11 [Anaerolineales bacterium]
MPFDHFDVIAPIYARVTYSSLDRMRQIAGLPAKGRLLDIGGGTGRVASALLKDVDEVLVADVSMGMLKQTHPATLKPVCSHSEFLPFPSDSFERVIMVDALHHVIDQPASAREMLRVLKPGGRIIIEEPDINSFGVKLIALAEKLLLMRSHFLAPLRIASLFPAGDTNIITEDSSAWVVISK